MQKTPIRVAVIGVGYFGKFHAQKYIQMDGVELVGVVDVSPETAQREALLLKTAWYTDYKEILGKVEAVSICVPTCCHYLIAKEFLLSGADVFIEKPITNTYEEAEELIQISKEKGKLIQVGHLEQFNPAMPAFKSLVEDPWIVEVSRLTPYSGRGTDVSVILDLMIHDIDLVLSIVKSDVKTVESVGEAVLGGEIDFAVSKLVFQNGCHAFLQASRVSPIMRREINVFQKNGSISLDFMNCRVSTVLLDAKKNTTVSTDKEFYDHDVLYGELISFINCVRTRKEPVITATMAQNALAIALEIMAKIKKPIFSSLSKPNPS